MKDIKGALMDDMKAMMQNELIQTLAGLIPPISLVPSTAIPPAAVAIVTANQHIVDAPHSNNDNARGNL